jgi:hypothetical protein
MLLQQAASSKSRGASHWLYGINGKIAARVVSGFDCRACNGKIAAPFRGGGGGYTGTKRASVPPRWGMQAAQRAQAGFRPDRDFHRAYQIPPPPARWIRCQSPPPGIECTAGEWGSQIHPPPIRRPSQPLFCMRRSCGGPDAPLATPTRHEESSHSHLQHAPSENDQRP